MDLKKAFGVQQALGKVIAEHNLEDGLRKVQSAEEFRRFIEHIPSTLPRDLLTQWVQRVEDSEWKKVRSKLLLGAQTAKGKVREVPDHEVERTGVAHR